MSVELAPCPFCGGSNVGVSTGQWGDEGTRDWLECRTCGTQQKPYDDEDPDGWSKMIAAWNTRPALPRLHEIEELREALTPSGDTKAAYHGEFSFVIMVEGPDEDDDELVPMSVSVPWTMVKEIMAAIRQRAESRTLLNKGGSGNG